MGLLVNGGENGNIFKAIFNHKYFENAITIVIVLTGILVGLQTSKEVNPNVSDFIIGSQITSSILAQLSEEPKLYDIFSTLFSAESGEIYLRDAGNYLDLGVEIEYSDIVGRCLLNNETAIGYINFYNGKPKININLSKDIVTNFDRGDKLIVISENF